MTNNVSTNLVFSVYRSFLLEPLTYVRFIGHIFGHVGFEHFLGNITMLLIIGLMLEEKYGSYNILFVILTAALVTGIVRFIFFPMYSFWKPVECIAVILLSSFVSFKDGTIPMTFVLVAVIYWRANIRRTVCT